MPRNTAVPAPTRRSAGLTLLLALLLAPISLAQGPEPVQEPEPAPTQQAEAQQTGAQQVESQVAPPAASTVHPFYRQLLDRGIYSYRQGDAETAVQELRFAVFGLLEEPALLTRGLAHLALAQQAAGQPEDAEESLGRLLTVEERFTVYRQAELSPELRQRLEDLMLSRVSDASLAGSATFRPLADERLRRKLAELPPRQRRSALIEAAARRPGNSTWQLALAELELAEGNAAEAARRADLVLGGEDAAIYEKAHCVRGAALAATDACAPALTSLELCPRRTTDAGLAAATLGCQAELGRWAEGAAFLTTVSPTVRQARPVARLARRVDKQASRLAAAQARGRQEEFAAADAGTEPADTEPRTEPAGTEPRTEPQTEAQTDGGPTPPSAATGVPANLGSIVLDSAEQDRLAEARRGLASATTAADLQRPLELARQVADTNPRSAEAQHLVGEIAYRASAWEQAARYFRRGGEPQRPELRFYLAVALFESGETQEARSVLERALPDLPRNPFVTSYAERIQNTAR